MAFAKLSAGLDVFSFDRKIIGFDTFEGFPHLDENDTMSTQHELLEVGALSTVSNIEEELNECIRYFDQERFANQFPKVELVKGDACQTIPQYIKDNPHTLVSLLFLDFDLYEPTKIALEYLAPRVVKGGIIAFDELNAPEWKGETLAALEYFGNFNRCELRSFDFCPWISYMII